MCPKLVWEFIKKKKKKKSEELGLAKDDYREKRCWSPIAIDNFVP